MKPLFIKIVLVQILLTCFCNAFGNEKKNGIKHSLENGKHIQKGSHLNQGNIALNKNKVSEIIFDEKAAAASDKTVRDSIDNTLRAIATNGAWIDNITDNMNVAAPFGMHKLTGGTTYDIAFSSISFLKTGAVARVFARCITPQKSATASTKTLYFAGNVSLARGGGVISDGKLFLVGNDVVSAGDQWSLSLNGITPGATGSTGSSSYFKFDCSGFTELGINGTVTLSNKYTVVDPKTFKPLTSASVSAPVVTALSKWDDLYAENLKFSGSFISKDIPGYVFSITTATLDFTDSKNPTGDPIKNYITSVQSVLPNTWRGLNITGIDVYLPKYFNAVNATDNAKISGTFAAIDDNGFSIKISGSNILDIKKGSANGWPVSIDKFELDIQKGVIAKGNFSGKLVLPIEDKTSDQSGIGYTASLNSDGGFDVTHGEINGIKADMWKGYLLVDPAFDLTLIVKDNKLLPKVNLSGKFSFSFNGGKLDPIPKKEEAKKSKVSFAIDDASFEELVLQTEAPFMAVKSMGAASQLQIGGFSADVSVEYQAKRPVKNDANAEYSCLHFDANVQLMDGKIGGGTGFDIYSRYDTAKREWKYDSYKLTQIKINAEFGKVSFDGTLDFMNDSIYGKGFNGVVKLKVSTIEVKAGAMFGNKYNSDGSSFSYWNVDAYAKGLNIKLFNIIEIQGFSGGATYRMDPVPPDNEHPITASGVSYIPNESSFLRLRAGVFLALVTKTVVSGWGGIEIVFNKNWGVDEFSISGNAQFFSTGVDEKSEKNKITPLTKGNKTTQASRLADAAAKAPPVKTVKTVKPAQTVTAAAPKITSKPLVDKTGKPLTTKKGKPLVSKTTEKTTATAFKDKSGKALLDKNGKAIQTTTATKTTSRAATTKSGKPILDPSGDPIMVNTTRKTVTIPVLDDKGKPVLDDKGNATFETQVQLIQPKVLKDKKGNLILDKKGNPVIKYKVKNKTKKQGEVEEEKEDDDDELEYVEGSGDDPEVEADKPNAADELTNEISDVLEEGDNAELTDVSQQLLIAKQDMETADRERKIALKNQHGPDSLVALLTEIIHNTQSSGDGNYQNIPVQNHNIFRSYLNDADKVAWPKVCEILNIPYNTIDITSTKKGNYSIPTATRIQKVKDSVFADKNAALLLTIPVRKETNELKITSTLYKDCKLCAEHPYSNMVRCKIGTDTAKNRVMINDWKKKRDSLTAVLAVLEERLTKLSDSANLIYDVYDILSDQWDIAKKGKSNLISSIKTEMIYYNEIANKRNNLVDSLDRYSKNVATPLDNIATSKTAIYNEKLSTYNTVLTKFNNLVTISEAASTAQKAKGPRVKLATGVVLTAAEKALIKSSDSLNALAATLQDNLNKLALAESAEKIKQDTAVKSAMSSALTAANAKVAQLKSNPNSQEYKDALQLQKNAQTNLEAFTAQLQQDSSVFRQDSALISENILSNNGGPVITVTPEQRYYVNKKYTTTVSAAPSGSTLPAAFFMVNNPDAASLKIYNHKSESEPRVITLYGPEYQNGKYTYLAQPGQDKLDAVKADAEALKKAKEWLDEADVAKLDSIEKAQPPEKRNAVMPVGTRPDGSPPFWGNFLAKVDLANEVLSFNMDVYASLETGSTTLFEGGNENKRDGSGEIYYSKKTWYINLGTKDNPMALTMNMGPITGRATTYFQATNALQSDGSDIVVKHGFGVKVQLDWSGGGAYASIGGGLAYDITIKHKDGFICSSTNQPAGLYGWYGKGNLSAYLAAEAGIKFTVFGQNVSFSVISGSITANLEVRAPNPIYFKGALNVKYSVGCCGLSWNGSFDVNMETGTYCSLDDK
ncbi:MAG: hypothetical protein JWN76_558 [Chitinophagaceae bacterium]|nr:hypothetical protein [Chitinophagaceae bacterium]